MTHKFSLVIGENSEMDKEVELRFSEALKKGELNMVEGQSD